MINVAILLFQGVRDRAQRLRRDERGASVLEWAMIAAVVVVAATVIGATIYNIVDDKSAQLEECSQVDVAAEC